MLEDISKFNRRDPELAHNMNRIGSYASLRDAFLLFYILLF